MTGSAVASWGPWCSKCPHVTATSGGPSHGENRQRRGGQAQFSDVVGAVRHGGQRFVIERGGTPVAAIVPVDDLVALESKASRGVLGLVGAFRDAKDLPRILDGVVRTRSR